MTTVVKGWLNSSRARYYTLLACKSGRIILAMYQDTNPEVERKLDYSPVTYAILRPTISSRPDLSA
jgi:hypothetical protein